MPSLFAACRSDSRKKEDAMKLKRLAAAALSAALMLSGCGSSFTSNTTTYQFGGKTVTLSGTLKEVIAPRGFSVKFDSVFSSKWSDSDGLYVYTATQDSIPYVLVDYISSSDTSPEAFLNDICIPAVKENYGDDLVSLEGVKTYEFDGTSMPGIFYTFHVGNATVHALRVCESVGSGFADYVMKYQDSGKSITMDTFEAIRKEFRLTDDTAVRTAAPASGTSSAPGTPSDLKGMKIGQTYAGKLSETMRTATYNGFVTISMPQSWNVAIGGANTGTWIRCYDPAEPSLQVYFMIHANVILKNPAAKQYYITANSLPGNVIPVYFAYAPVNTSATLEEFYTDNYNEYISMLAGYEPAFSGFYFPQISSFSVIERMPARRFLPVTPLDNQVLHAEFRDGLTNTESEGMFFGSVFDEVTIKDTGIDTGFYGIYSLTGMSAPKGMLKEYLPLLQYILNSFAFTDAFISGCAAAQGIDRKNMEFINSMMAETSSVIVNGWNQRQTTYDILSQEYSDSIMGYDRYLDTDTNEVYRVELGLMDHYDGKRYVKLEQGSDRYTDPIAGYITKG